ncbi:DUF1330 domain-containing protein [Phaeobacter sp. C3_T13_0]|uniref:DUF1330 domain-containing protein n=1 Tax=Phaeobacter cretensis TaxID=3342641 RepID=UPI0039BD8484
MNAFLVSRIRVKDPAKMQEYAQAAGPTIASYGGQLVVRGTFAKPLLGEADDHQATTIIQFPDLAAIDACFSSPEYQALTALREAAGDMQLLAYEDLAN